MTGTARLRTEAALVAAHRCAMDISMIYRCPPFHSPRLARGDADAPVIAWMSAAAASTTLRDRREPDCPRPRQDAPASEPASSLSRAAATDTEAARIPTPWRDPRSRSPGSADRECPAWRAYPTWPS